MNPLSRNPGSAPSAKGHLLICCGESSISFMQINNVLNLIFCLSLIEKDSFIVNPIQGLPVKMSIK